MQVKLKVLSGKNAGKKIAIPVKRFLIGRGEDCHLRPKSDAISRNHCAILINDEEVVVRDLNSRNGTFLNGDRINGDITLKEGDTISIGKLEFEVNIKVTKPVKKAVPVVDRSDSGSMDFDVTEWLEEADDAAKSARTSDPETRQYKLDETDRIALEKAEQAAEVEPQSDSVSGDMKRSKAEPGKLPVQSGPSAATSRDAAADMLKKFFNNR